MTTALLVGLILISLAAMSIPAWLIYWTYRKVIPDLLNRIQAPTYQDFVTTRDPVKTETVTERVLADDQGDIGRIR